MLYFLPSSAIKDAAPCTFSSEAVLLVQILPFTSVHCLVSCTEGAGHRATLYLL